MILQPLSGGNTSQNKKSTSSGALQPLSSIKSIEKTTTPTKFSTGYSYSPTAYKTALDKPLVAKAPEAPQTPKTVWDNIQGAVSESIKRGSNAMEKVSNKELSKNDSIGAKVGRKLQQIPNADLGSKGQKLFKSTDTETKIVNFISNIPSSLLQSWGQTMEQVGTQPGRDKLKADTKSLPKTMSEVKTHIDNKEWQKAFEVATNNSAFTVALDVADFIPIGGLASIGIKKGIKTVFKQGGKEAVEQIVKEVPAETRKLAQTIVKEALEESEKELKTVKPLKSETIKPKATVELKSKEISDPLTQEATKYKSAEEFVDSMLFRGEPGKFRDIKIDKRSGIPKTTAGYYGYPTTSDFDYATNRFAKNWGDRPSNEVRAFVPKSDAKILSDKKIILDFMDSGKEVTMYKNPNSGSLNKTRTNYYTEPYKSVQSPNADYEKLYLRAKKAGYDAVDLRGIDGMLQEKEVRIINPSAFIDAGQNLYGKPKSQLTDIWNKANKPTKEKKSSKPRPEELDPETRSLLTGSQAQEANATKPIDKRTQAELKDRLEELEIRRSKVESDRAILSNFDSDMLKGVRRIQRKLAIIEKRGGDPTEVTNDKAYKTYIEDLMAFLNTNSEDKAIDYLLNDFPEPIRRVSTKEDLEEIRYLKSKLNPKEVEVPRDQIPVGKGKEKVSRLEARVKNVLKNAPEETKEGLGLSTYNQMNKADQIKKATEYVAKHPDDALKIIKGDLEAPQGILKNSIYVALENYAVLGKDMNLARKIASLESTRLGQEINILSELNPESPVKIIRDVIKVREEAFQNRYRGKSAKQVSSKVVKDIQKRVKTPDKYDWNKFVESIKC